jgi:hypothetical protein
MSDFPFPVLFYLFVRDFFLKFDLTLLRKSLLHLTLSQENSVASLSILIAPKIMLGKCNGLWSDALLMRSLL